MPQWSLLACNLCSLRACQAPLAQQLYVNVGVAASNRERRSAGLTAHQSPANNHPGRLIKAHARLGLINTLKFHLARFDCPEQRRLGDFQALHHVDEQEIVRQNSAQTGDIRVDERSKELAVYFYRVWFAVQLGPRFILKRSLRSTLLIFLLRHDPCVRPAIE
jgi:hypothetical protein